MAADNDDSLLLDVSDLSSGLSLLIKQSKPLMTAKGAVIDATKLCKVAMNLRKLIAASMDLAKPDDEGAKSKTKERVLWAQSAMEELLGLDAALAKALRAVRFDPSREGVKVVKALKAADTAAGRPTWAKPKVAELTRSLPGAGDLGEEKTFCGVDSRNISAFPLLILVSYMNTWMKAELARLPNL